MIIPIGTKVIIKDKSTLGMFRCLADTICTVIGYENNPPTAITRLQLKTVADTLFRYPTLFPWEIRVIDSAQEID